MRNCVIRDGYSTTAVGAGRGPRGAEGEGGGRSSSSIALAKSRVTALSLRSREGAAEEGWREEANGTGSAECGRGWLPERARWVVAVSQEMGSGEEKDWGGGERAVEGGCRGSGSRGDGGGTVERCWLVQKRRASRAEDPHSFWRRGRRETRKRSICLLLRLSEVSLPLSQQIQERTATFDKSRH